MGSQETVGFIGLGAMGSSMARNIARAGYPVVLFDLDAARAGAIAADAEVEEHVSIAESVYDLVTRSTIICTSLPHPPVFVSVAQKELLPAIRAGSVVIDFGTTLPSETRRLAAEFARVGAALVDAPVSGGAGGAEAGRLRVFVGGETEHIDCVRPVLGAIGDPDRIVHCGRSGQGQVVKACNQLMMGLVNAALLETAGLGLQAGVPAEVLDHALGGSGGARALLSAVLRRVSEGSAEEIGVKSLQLADYAEEASRSGWNLPLSAAIAEFLTDADLVVQEANRLSPSFLRELTSRRRS